MRTLLVLFFSFGVYKLAAWELMENPRPRQINDRTIAAEKHYLSGYAPTAPNGMIRVVIEIPTGSVDKWEVDKEDGFLHWEMQEGKPRKVRYLGYPANYGMVPRTLLPEASGGDGDPLDVIVLGPPLVRGSIVQARLLGVLKLNDSGEVDDKLIAVLPGTPFFRVSDMDALQTQFPGVTRILQTWFTSYKGAGRITSSGYADQLTAQSILDTAIEAFAH